MQFPLMITETKISTVIAGSTAWDSLDQLVTELTRKDGKVFILTDDNTSRLCLPVLLAKVQGFQKAVMLNISPGESGKNPENAVSLWNALASAEAGRNSLLINLGGGVVSDLGGFVASTYKRGIPFINIPTTLMAMADAAIGGKTAINLQSVKNIVGSFYLPEATFLCPEFLSTLNKSHLLSGLAEIFKIALAADKPFWEYLNTLITGQLFTTPLNLPLWEELIARSAMIKCKIVEADFFEKDSRAVLNFGHTIGHAIESLSFRDKQMPLTHGEAIAIGILCESYLSMHQCGLEEKEFRRITQLFISTFGDYGITDKDIPVILGFLNQDKKIRDGIQYFTLISSPGKAMIKQPCDRDQIIRSLEFYRNLTSKH